MAQAIIGALRAELSAGVAKFADDMGKAANSVNRFARDFQRTGQSISRVGQNISLRVSAPILAMGGFALRAAGDFEQAMNRVGAISGATEDQLKSLSDVAKELGRTTQFTASESADAMTFLAMAGFEVNEILGAMPATLSLAAAGQLEIARAADIVSNILTGYRMNVEDLEHAVDVLSKTFTSTNTDLEMLGEAMKYAGPVAAAAGMEFEEAAAAIGLMGNAGIQASMAGTSLRGAITRMLNPTASIQNLIDDLGLSEEEAGEFADDMAGASANMADAMRSAGIQFEDAQGRLLPLADIIEQLEPHANDAGLMMQLFGLRAGPAMAGLVAQGAGALRELTAELENSGGTADLIADKQLEGFNGQMIKLRSAFESLQIAIGESGLLEFMTGMAERLTEWVRAMSETNPEALKWITIIGAAVAVLGPLIFFVGQAMIGIAGLTIAFSWFLASGPKLVTAFKNIAAGVAFLATPLGLVIVAIAALAAAWYFYGDEIKAYVGPWVERIDAVMGGRLTAIFDGARAVFGFFVDQLKLGLQLLGQVLTGDLAGAFDTFKQGWANLFGAIIDIVGKAVAAIGDWLKGKLFAIFDSVGEKIEAVKGAFKGMYDAVVGGSYVPDMVDGIIAEMDRLQDGFVTPAEQMTSEVGSAFEGLKDQVAGVFDEMIQTGKVSSGTLKNLVGGIFGQMFGIGNVFSPSGGTSLGGMIASGIGSIFGGSFGGGLANGGLAMAGRPYMVGERGPELFRPHVSGTVEPGSGGAGGTTQIFNIQTPDANSFRRSERQIMRTARQKMSQ